MNKIDKPAMPKPNRITVPLNEKKFVAKIPRKKITRLTIAKFSV